MKKAILVCGWQDAIPHDMQGDVIGIDRGASLLARQGIAMKFAIGDFDSIDPNEKANIRKFAEDIVELDAHKDISDTEAAVNTTLARGYDDLVLWGGLGGRFDHALVNLKLVERHACLRLMDACNEVYTLSEGEHDIEVNDKPYLSVFALMDSEISLFGCAYPLEHARFTQDMTLGLSNQIDEEKARISVHKGRVLIVRSRDK
jgi:thiamine pyrophosphokinase